MEDILLRYRAYANIRDKTVKTPLVVAINNMDMKTAKLLVRNGANIQNSPELLRIAIYNESSEFVEFLLKHNADVNAKDDNGRTALHHAVSKHSYPIIKTNRYEDNMVQIIKLLILNGADVNARTHSNTTALYTAVCRGHIKIIRALLQYDVNVNSLYVRNETVLHSAVLRNCVQSTKMLLRKGAEVNAKSMLGLTALHTAAMYGFTNIVKILIKCGATYDTTSLEGMTSLHFAALHDFDRIVTILLNVGADVNLKDVYGRTALYHALCNRNSSNIKRLLECGSDINALNTMHYNPLNDLLDSIDSTNQHGSTNYHRIEQVLKFHVMKSKAMGLYFSERLSNLIKNEEETPSYRKCEREIERLRNERISDNIFLYDILKKSSRYLMVYAMDENVISLLDSGFYETRYPIYIKMIVNNYKRGKKKARIVKSLNALSGFTLPHLVIEGILRHLSHEDILNVLEVCSTIDTSKVQISNVL